MSKQTDQTQNQQGLDLSMGFNTITRFQLLREMLVAEVVVAIPLTSLMFKRNKLQ